MRRLLITFLCMALVGGTLWSQNQTWSLERCVSYALENNLNLQQAQLNTRNSELDLKQNQYNRLPNVSGSVSAGYQFGRTIDPTTNEFSSTSIGFNSYSINGGATLFNGNAINNSIKRARLDYQSMQLDLETQQQTIALTVATAYLNVLLAQEQLSNTQFQLDLSQQQLEQTNRLIEVGQLPANSRLDLEAQLARNRQLNIEAQNSVAITTLNLKQLLQLDPGQPMALDVPEVEIDQATLVREFQVEEVYLAALQTQPDVRSAELQMQSAQYGEKIARSGYLPTLTVFGSLSTNYSSVNPDFTNPNLDNAELVESAPTPVTINGDPALATFFDLEGIVFPTTPYIDQFTENFGQSLGVSMRIPIYSNHSNRINTERARLNVIGAEIQSRQIRDQLKVNVQNAVTNFKASRDAFLAAERSLTASQAAFSDAQRRFDLGAINAFDYNNAVDNLDIARTELTRAKYQLLFNLKVVEFYLGEPLEL